MNRVLTLIIIALLLILLAMGRLNSEGTDLNSSGTKWTGKQELEQISSDEKSIAIPGQSEIYFNAGKTCQKVNIYNPEENDCSMIFTLIADGEEIWKSGECFPGYGYYTIDIERPLETGTYDAILVHECFRDSIQLNTANINLKLIVL